MLKSSIFYIPIAVLACLFAGCIIAAIVANIYLFCKEVSKVKKPARMTTLCVSAVLVAIALIF